MGCPVATNAGKDAENPRLRNGKYAGPNTRIPRLVRGRYAALRLASEARTRRLAEYAAAYSDSAPSTRIPRPRTRTRLASEYAARGFSASLASDIVHHVHDYSCEDQIRNTHQSVNEEIFQLLLLREFPEVAAFDQGKRTVKKKSIVGGLAA